VADKVDIDPLDRIFRSVLLNAELPLRHCNVQSPRHDRSRTRV